MSVSTNAALGIGAAAAVAPLVAPYVHNAIDKLSAPKDEGPQVVVPLGTVKPDKD